MAQNKCRWVARSNHREWPGIWAADGHRSHGRLSTSTQPLMDGLRAKYGPNFRMHLAARPVLIVGGPDAVREVFLDRDKNFSSELGWKKSIGKLFARGLMLKDFDEHRVDRRLMQMAFRNEAMRGYVDTMTSHISTAVRTGRATQLSCDQASHARHGFQHLSRPRARPTEPRRQMKRSVAAVQASVFPRAGRAAGVRIRSRHAGRRTLERFFTTLIRGPPRKPWYDSLSELCRAKSGTANGSADQAITIT